MPLNELQKERKGGQLKKRKLNDGSIQVKSVQQTLRQNGKLPFERPKEINGKERPDHEEHATNEIVIGVTGQNQKQVNSKNKRNGSSLGDVSK